jgi:hypothetical protein
MSRRTPAEPEIAGTPITGVEALQVDAGGTPKPMALTDYKLGHLPDTGYGTRLYTAWNKH